MVHVYKHGDNDGLHFDANRVTLRDGENFGVEGRALILGTLPNVNVIRFEEIRWFWIEES